MDNFEIKDAPEVKTEGAGINEASAARTDAGVVAETAATEIKVSVIMPVYNAAPYLRPALDTVIDQTLREIEIICIDDGSTDKSLEIIKEYQKKDSRIRIVTENNAGPAAARNKGIVRARGEYIAFLDADDFYEASLLSELYELAKEHSLDIAVADYDIYNSKKARFVQAADSDFGAIFSSSPITSKNEYPDYILQATTGYVWNKLFKREFIAEKGLAFMPELYVFEDVHFVTTCLSMAEKIGKVSKVLAHHRVYSAQSRARVFRKHYLEVPAVYVKIKEFLMHNGMYVPLRRSFLNLAASRCYSIYNLLWHDAKGEFWNMLHESYAEELGWMKAEPEYFESSEVCDFVASVLIYNHKQYVKREDKGLKVKIKSVGRELKTIQLRKRTKAFFDKILGKNKKDNTEL